MSFEKMTIPELYAKASKLQMLIDGARESVLVRSGWQQLLNQVLMEVARREAEQPRFA